MYDVRELTGLEDEGGSMVSSLEREKGVLVDDLRWQGQLFLLSCETLYSVSVCVNGATPVYIFQPNTISITCGHSFVCTCVFVCDQSRYISCTPSALCVCVHIVLVVSKGEVFMCVCVCV